MFLKMIILTNEYKSSLAHSNSKVKGGPARFALDFSAYATSQGHEWIGLIHAPQTDKIKKVKDGSDTHTKKQFYTLPLPKTTTKGLGDVTIYQDPSELFQNEIVLVSDLIKHIKPDVVLLNGFSVYAWVLFKSAHACGVPVVIQHAGIMAREVEEYKDRFTDAAQKVCTEMERNAAEYATANVFLNEWSKNQFKEILRPKKINGEEIIPLPHPGLTFQSAERKKNGGEIRIGVVARWDRIKNHNAVYELAKLVREQQLPWSITSVTAIPDSDIQKEFKNHYKKIISVIPSIDRESIADFYRLQEIMILPSHFDVSPTVVMEAISVGVPTLISKNAGWVSEYERFGMRDWIADFSDPRQAAHIISKHLSRSKWPEIKKFAAHIKETHNPESVYEQYLQLFTRVITS